MDLGMLLFDRRLHPAAKARREWFEVDKKRVFVRMNELVVLLVKCECRDNAVDVRMVLHLPSPGMKDGGEPTRSALVFGSDDIRKSTGTFLEDEIVELLRMSEAERSQFRRQGKGDHEVGNRQEAGFLFCAPDPLVEGTALGAVAVVATVVGKVVAGAVATLIELPTQFRSATHESASHGPVVGCGETRAIGTGVARPMLLQKLCESQ